jgi:hypothetical protein
MSAKERIAGDILEGAEFLKRGTQVTSDDKVMARIQEALLLAPIEWIE